MAPKKGKIGFPRMDEGPIVLKQKHSSYLLLVLPREAFETFRVWRQPGILKHCNRLLEFKTTGNKRGTIAPWVCPKNVFFLRFQAIIESTSGSEELASDLSGKWSRSSALMRSLKASYDWPREALHWIPPPEKG